MWKLYYHEPEQVTAIIVTGDSEEVAKTLLDSYYTIEDREKLRIISESPGKIKKWPEYVLNEAIKRCNEYNQEDYPDSSCNS
jgi:hypothetical protein